MSFEQTSSSARPPARPGMGLQDDLGTLKPGAPRRRRPVPPRATARYTFYDVHMNARRGQDLVATR